jgi:hypothetical protein
VEYGGPQLGSLQSGLCGDCMETWWTRVFSENWVFGAAER